MRCEKRKEKKRRNRARAFMDCGAGLGTKLTVATVTEGVSGCLWWAWLLVMKNQWAGGSALGRLQGSEVEVDCACHVMGSRDGVVESVACSKLLTAPSMQSQDGASLHASMRWTCSQRQQRPCCSVCFDSSNKRKTSVKRNNAIALETFPCGSYASWP